MEQDQLAHYGVPRKSGRYPWGSGKRPKQRENAQASYKSMAKDAKKFYKDGDKEAITKSIGTSIDRAESIRDEMPELKKRTDDAYRLKNMAYSDVLSAVHNANSQKKRIRGIGSCNA